MEEGREKLQVYMYDCVTISNYTILLTITLVYTPLHGCRYSNLLVVVSQDSLLSLSFGSRGRDVLSLRSASVTWGVFSKTFHKISWGTCPSGYLQR